MANVATRQYFIDALAGKETVSDPLISKGSGNVIIVFAVPLISDGNPVGIVMGSVNFDAIGAMINQVDLGQTGEAYLIDKTGLMVSPPKYEDFLKSTGAIKDTALLQYKVDTYASEQILAGNSGIGDYQDYRGKAVVGSYTWIPSLHLGLILEEEQSELMAPVMQNLTLMIGLTFASILVLTVIVFFVARGISSPLVLMKDVTEKLTVGDLNRDMPEEKKATIRRWNDELGAVGRSLTKVVEYITEMAVAATRIADGDLTVEVTPKSEKDELGKAFAKMVASLRSSFAQVGENAGSLSAASEQLASAASQAGQATSQIAATMQQVAGGNSQQTQSISRTAESIEQTSRAIDGVAKGAQEQAASIGKASTITAQISQSVQQVADNAQAVTNDSAQAAQAAKEGYKTVRETIQGMENIKSKVDLSANKVLEMGTRSGQIGTIVETIDDIASQTNLLALNAAIEAARAGEHGKGFAVVADEVRKLAEKSAGATREIAVLIKGIQSTVNEAVEAMKESAHEVETGVMRANNAGQALESITRAVEAVYNQAGQAAKASVQMKNAVSELVGVVESVSAIVEENTAATEEMSANSHEVNQAIENIASVSEENAASVEEVSASAEEMSAQVEEVTASAQSLAEMANELQQMVAHFKLSNEKQSLQEQPPAIKPTLYPSKTAILADRRNIQPSAVYSRQN
jgi:methyl-accepting chemotaxis protein